MGSALNTEPMPPDVMVLFRRKKTEPSAVILSPEHEAQVRSEIEKGMEGKPQSWLEDRRMKLNDAWKKTHGETRSMFCAKGKHVRCSFDKDCSCSCHADTGSVAVIAPVN